MESSKEFLNRINKEYLSQLEDLKKYDLSDEKKKMIRSKMRRNLKKESSLRINQLLGLMEKKELINYILKGKFQ